jgi:hypothetical protein
LPAPHGGTSRRRPHRKRGLKGLAITATPEVVLADAGYWHQAQMEAVVDRGMQVLIPSDAGKRKGHPPRLGRRSLRVHAPRGRDRPRRRALPKRQGMIEPVFTDAKFNRRCGPLATPRQIRREVGMAPRRTTC